MSVATNKIDKINIRINSKDKKSLEKAAELNHLSLSAYIISTCLKQAELDSIRNDVLHLNSEQMEFVVNMLKKPPKPNKELKKLFK